MAQASALPISRKRRAFGELLGVTCWAIVPIKPSAERKSRLAGVLAADQRERLVDTMLAHVINTVSAAPAIAHTCLLGREPKDLPQTVSTMADPGGGLNM